jgi:DNA-binding NarL/FixJ family response regulator
MDSNTKAFFLATVKISEYFNIIKRKCNMIRIAIFSQYKEDRQTIKTLLTEQKDFLIVNIGKDGVDALRSAKTSHPDIIIMDFILSDVDSTVLASAIKRNSPSTELIVLYSCEEEDATARAFKAGISGCLPRQGAYADLVSAVRSVFYGGLYLSEIDRKYALNYMWKTEKYTSQEGFSISRMLFSITEICIFNNIILGFTDKEIAKSLNMTINSLRNCVNRIKQKTGLHNRTQITICALLSGIMNLPTPESGPTAKK